MAVIDKVQIENEKIKDALYQLNNKSELVDNSNQ